MKTEARPRTTQAARIQTRSVKGGLDPQTHKGARGNYSLLEKDPSLQHLGLELSHLRSVREQSSVIFKHPLWPSVAAVPGGPGGPVLPCLVRKLHP